MPGGIAPIATRWKLPFMAGLKPRPDPAAKAEQICMHWAARLKSMP